MQSNSEEERKEGKRWKEGLVSFLFLPLPSGVVRGTLRSPSVHAPVTTALVAREEGLVVLDSPV